jgi:hypothetical protein
MRGNPIGKVYCEHPKCYEEHDHVGPHRDFSGEEIVEQKHISPSSGLLHTRTTNMPTEELTPHQEYVRDYYAPDAVDWTEEEMAEHTPQEVFDRSQRTAARRAEVEKRYRERAPEGAWTTYSIDNPRGRSG